MRKVPSIIPWLVCVAIVMVAAGVVATAWNAAININRDGTPLIRRQKFIETPDGEVIPMHITK